MLYKKEKLGQTHFCVWGKLMVFEITWFQAGALEQTDATKILLGQKQPLGCNF